MVVLSLPIIFHSDDVDHLGQLATVVVENLIEQSSAVSELDLSCLEVRLECLQREAGQGFGGATNLPANLDEAEEQAALLLTSAKDLRLVRLLQLLTLGVKALEQVKNQVVALVVDAIDDTAESLGFVYV